MTLHPLLTKSLLKIIADETDMKISLPRCDGVPIEIIERNTHPNDPPIGIVVDIEIYQHESVRLIIEREPECPDHLKP